MFWKSLSVGAAWIATISCRSAPPNAASHAEVEVERGEVGPIELSTKPSSAPAAPSVIRLPMGERGIGFDDLGFAHGLRKVLAPGGGTGRLDLINPDTFEVTAVTLGNTSAYSGGHDDGVTSADSDGTHVFVTDRTSRRLLMVDPSAGAVQSSAPLTGHPDYVRWVASTKELWVTEPNEERIEVFSRTNEMTIRSAAEIRVAGGPESLVVPDSGRRAFTHLWNGVTLAIDETTRSIVGKWPNGCRGSRGIAYDEAGIVLAACAEGKLVALDANHGGRELGSTRTSGGVDVIAYDPSRRHAYVPSSEGGNMTIVGVSTAGELQSLQVIPTAKGSHCVTRDDRDHVWVCDPTHGQLLLFTDSFQ
jgi:DNA-binding beta-propeller fold protein YncE